MRGTLVEWIKERGFGFVSPEDGGADLFCHASSLEDGLEVATGSLVEFDEGVARSGKPCAVNVRVIS
jgi:CspA family cold shock protein